MSRNTIIFFITWLVFTQAAIASFADRDDIKKFIAELSISGKFTEQELHSWFSSIEPLPEVIHNMLNPAENLPWQRYRQLMVSEARITQGVNYYNKYKHLLANAEKIFGVDASIITAIIGVESNYGKNSGKYPTLQTLTTLAFDYPKRSNFFRKELVEYLLLTKENGLDPLTIKGSYAGALGVPQFIASSYRAYAIDLNNKKPIDLANNMEQVIASVANYLHKFGWQHNQGVAYPLGNNLNIPAHLIAKDKSNPKPHVSFKTLLQHGVTLPSHNLTEDSLLSVLELDNNERWLAENNFYVITRYNHSSFYAMVIHQLSQKIKTKVLT